MIPRHARMMRNGWSIPHSLEWLFWPLRTEERIDHDLTPQESLRRRFKLTNHHEFMAVLRELRVVKEA